MNISTVHVRLAHWSKRLSTAAQRYVKDHGGWRRSSLHAARGTVLKLMQSGPMGLLHHLVQYAQEAGRLPPFLQNQLSPDQAARCTRNLESQPTVSLIIPVYRVAPKWIDLCIRSVINQYYENWELILVDDCSRQRRLTRTMRAWTQRDARIRLIELEENQHISGASNAGIAEARGEFIGFVDHDDEITPDALTWFVNAHNQFPEAKWFYSDETKVDEQGRAFDVHFKPDFSPEYLLGAMYTCHLSIYEAKVLRQVGGLRKGFEGSQDHDLALRLSEVVSCDQVVHIPRVLYKWRAIEGSTALNMDGKSYAPVAGRKAVKEALERRNLKADVESHPLLPTLYHLHLKPQRHPKVSVIIPTRNSTDLLNACLRSLRCKTNYPNYEIVIIDNQSDDPELHHYLDRQQQAGVVRVLKYDLPFNHSAMNNIAVAQSDAEYVVFMNNDIEILADDWLETLVATAEIDPQIAAVGAKLIYPDETIQHAGIVLRPRDVCVHAHQSLPNSVGHIGHGGRLSILNEFVGATAALLLMRKSAFEEVGGLDEQAFPASYNDIDLCLRLREAGYRCLFNPAAAAIHYESKTRKIDKDLPIYARRMRKRWHRWLAYDPFYNPNFHDAGPSFREPGDYPVRTRYVNGKEFLEVGCHAVRPAAAADEPSEHPMAKTLPMSKPPSNPVAISRTA